MSSGEWPAEDTCFGNSVLEYAKQSVWAPAEAQGGPQGASFRRLCSRPFAGRLLALPSYRVAPGDRALPHAPTATEEFRILVSN